MLALASDLVRPLIAAEGVHNATAVMTRQQVQLQLKVAAKVIPHPDKVGAIDQAERQD